MKTIYALLVLLLTSPLLGQVYRTNHVAGLAPATTSAMKPSEIAAHMPHALHVFLDGVGFVPYVGEWADGANAIIYSAKGEYFNAAISGFSIVAPVAGDAVGKSIKYTVLRNGSSLKTFNCHRKATKFLNDCLKWGAKPAYAKWSWRELAANLGTKGTRYQAHHIIPKYLIFDKDVYVVRWAIEAGFDFNGSTMKRKVINGIALEPWAHEGHHLYNDKLRDFLLNAQNRGFDNKHSARVFLEELCHTIRIKIMKRVQNNQHINHVTFHH